MAEANFSALTDDQLLDLLRAATAPEPPEHHVDMLMMGYDLLQSDDLIADLVQPATATSAREPAPVPQLTFTYGAVTFDVELLDNGATIVGQVIGASPAEIVLESAGGTASSPVDDVGRFRFDRVRGPVRLRIEHDGARVVTPWFIP